MRSRCNDPLTIADCGSWLDQLRTVCHIHPLSDKVMLPGRLVRLAVMSHHVDSMIDVT